MLPTVPWDGCIRLCYLEHTLDAVQVHLSKPVLGTNTDSECSRQTWIVRLLVCIGLHMRMQQNMLGMCSSLHNDSTTKFI